jgi:hypothetical protein
MSRLRARIALGSALVAISLLLAACSGTHGQSGVTTKPSTSTTTTVRTSTPTTTRTLRNWSPLEDVSHGVALEAVSCPNTRTCIALGANGQAYHYSRGVWSSPVATGAAGGATGPPSLSCAGPTFCMAEWRGTSDAVIWNGTSWESPMTIGGSQELQSVGCASSTFCVTVDGIGSAYYYTGSSNWSFTPNDWGSVTSISCITSAFCVSVKGGVSIWDGNAWTEPQVYGTSSVLTGVSCASTSFCMAVDATGEGIFWDGTIWIGPQLVEGESPTFGGPSMAGVSCTADNFCLAVDSDGRAFQWSGRKWLAAEPSDPGHSFAAVSCATTAFCMAVDKQGYALIRT